MRHSTRVGRIERRTTLLIAQLLLATAPLTGCFGPSATEVRSAHEAIQAGVARRLAAPENSHALRPVTRTFYAGHPAPAFGDADANSPLIAQALAAIKAAAQDGLEPADYHAEDLSALLAVPSRSPDQKASLDLLLTDGLLGLWSDLAYGRVHPESLKRRRLNAGHQGVLVDLLASALASHRLPPRERFLPQDPGYSALLAALARLQALAERSPAWAEPLPPTPRQAGLHPEPIARRLELLGDLSALDVVRPSELSAGLERFQRRHGLMPTGHPDQETLAELTIPPAARAEQIRLNLERWRARSRTEPSTSIFVDLPRGELDMRRAGEPSAAMRIVFGRPDRPSPVLSSTITRILLNPRWLVPPSIAGADLLPRLQKDPNYLADNGFTVFPKNDGTTALDPATIDWQSLSPSNFPYRLVQAAGGANALGRIEFLFPNGKGVYLHDTPARALFARSDRAESSGCIRVERPIDLALFLLGPSSAWSQGSLTASIASEKPTTIVLDPPVPIAIVYRTAWVAADGQLQLRRDVYQKDAALGAALRRLAAQSNFTPSKPSTLPATNLVSPRRSVGR